MEFLAQTPVGVAPKMKLAPLLLATCAAGRVGLHKAAADGDLEPLKVAINGKYDAYEERRIKPDVNKRNAKGRVPLHLAICNKRGTIEPARTLLELGEADASARDGDDQTPLHVVAASCVTPSSGYKSDLAGHESDLYPFAKLLLKHGADPNAAIGESELTPLHVAAGGARTKLVELLLRKGAAVDARDSDGATALHHAARAGSNAAVVALIEAGADPQAADSAGKVARDLAVGTDSFSGSIRNNLDNAAGVRAKAVKAKAERAAAKARAKAEL